MGHKKSKGSLITYWVLDGDSSSYELREEIKAWGGYFDRDHKKWCIDGPDKSCIQALSRMGLNLQWRRGA